MGYETDENTDRPEIGFLLEVEEQRQRSTDWGVTRDIGRIIQMYNTFTDERRSELIQFATRLLVAQSIEAHDRKSVKPNSDDVTVEIRDRLDESQPRDGIGQGLSILNGYTTDVDEAFFPDGKEEVVVGGSLYDWQYACLFDKIYRHQCQRESYFDVPTVEQLYWHNRDLESDLERTWFRVGKFEDWLREWRDRFYYDLLGGHPFKVSDPYRRRHSGRDRPRTVDSED